MLEMSEGVRHITPCYVGLSYASALLESGAEKPLRMALTTLIRIPHNHTTQMEEPT